MATNPTANMTKKQTAAYTAALQEIEACRTTGETMAVFNGIGLSILPPEIGQLSALTALHLHNNQLRTLPPEIGQLSALTELYLDNNQLTTFPPEIGQLAELEVFTINGNPLQALPPEAVPLLSPDFLDPAHRQLWNQAKRALG